MKSGKKRIGGAAADFPVAPGAEQCAKLVPLRPRRQCPICGKKTTRAAYPFCSVRCADADLDRWFSGRYRVAGSGDDDDAPHAQSPPAGHAPGFAPEKD